MGWPVVRAWWRQMAAGSPADDREVRVAADAGPPPTGIDAKLAAAQAARAGRWVATRDQALAHSVVNRARDLYCGILAGCPFTRIRTRGDAAPEDLGPGWLSAPDPFRTRAGFVAAVTDDLFFRGWAFAHVTARDTDNHPVALEHMPWDDTFPMADVGVFRWFRRDLITGQVLDEVVAERRDVVVWESPVQGVLEVGSASVVTIGAELDGAARMFAASGALAGVLEDDPGNEPMSMKEAIDTVQQFQDSRRVNTVAYVRNMKYRESQMDPSRLQLVEGRAYQDAAIARVCNVPNYAVGVGVPNDSLTYKTAATARFDLLDFGLSPFVTCWESTLSGDDVVPHGTAVAMDVGGFLRTDVLAGLPTAGVVSVPGEVAAK